MRVLLCFAFQSVSQSAQMLTVKLNNVRHQNVSNAEFVAMLFSPLPANDNSDTVFDVPCVCCMQRYNHLTIFYGFSTWHINVNSRIKNTKS